MSNHFDEVLKKINPAKIRNFSIIAHIDHGKSTLADRLLEKTNLKNSSKSFERILDSLSLEQEKGITIKLNAVQLYYPPESPEPYIFNLIDTPGHVDFMYEVSRSLAACEGVILLVDATKGIQAQTLAYYEVAKNLELKILPVINKIDLPSAQLTTTKTQLIELLNCQESDICLISAKTGKNVDLLLENIIKIIPKATFREGLLCALIFDLFYSRYYGVVIYVRIFEGELAKGQKVKFHSSQKIYQVERLGVKTPKEILKKKLIAGEIG
ncbi:13871_t:CDS:1 [Funneliformis geosporum]|nr:13871_t:CDS:1 [Funneliformis geosporum]